MHGLHQKVYMPAKTALFVHPYDPKPVFTFQVLDNPSMFNQLMKNIVSPSFFTFYVPQDIQGYVFVMQNTPVQL